MKSKKMLTRQGFAYYSLMSSQAVKSFRFISITLLTSLLPFPSQAGIIGTDQCLLDTSGFAGCTANDVGIANIRIKNVLDGCVSTNDTAVVNIEVDITSGQPDRYGVGIYLDLKGGDAIASGNTCVHEALYDIGSPVNATSGIGPFYDSPDDLAGNTCGSVGGKVTFTRIIVEGDIISPSPSSTIAKELTVNCSDVDNNGFLDIGWAVGWTVDKASACTTISQAIAEGPSKCQSGLADSGDDLTSIPIGVPNLGLTITCVPDAGNADPDGDSSTLAIGETATCTVRYENTGTGPADNIEFHLGFTDANGNVDNIAVPGSTSDSFSQTSSSITWVVDDVGGQVPNRVNIPAGGSGDMTFTYISTYDEEQINEPITVTAFYNDGTNPVVAQPLTATTAITLPVTISSIYPQKTGHHLNVSFSTASETLNAGFNIYAVNGNHWIKLNESLIQGALDSFDPIDYAVNFDIPQGVNVKKVGIAGVDINGNEDRYGPFELNKQTGTKAFLPPIDWVKVHKQIKNKRKITKRSSGKVVINVDVTEDGIYSITNSDFIAAGIDAVGKVSATDIAISYRGNGVARDISGLDKKGRWADTSVIQFMAYAPKGERALYLAASIYNLSLDKSLMIESNAIEPITKKVLTLEANNKYAYTLPGSDPFYDVAFYAQGSHTPGFLSRQFDLPLMPAGSSDFTVYVAALSDTHHHLLVSLNGVEVADINASGWTDLPISFAVDNSTLKQTDNILTLTALGEGSTFDIFVYDKTTISYDDGKPVATKIPATSVVSIVDKKEIEAKNNTDLVIISHPLFIGEVLDRYMAQRKKEGWKIKLVNVNNIYSAYGFDMATPMAIKAYLDDVATAGVTHVQLVGAANYDYHNYLGYGSVSFIGSLYTYTGESSNYTPCDTCLVMDEDGLPKLAIGRWPVRTLEGLEAVVNKSLAWDSSGQSSAHTALFIADKKDNGLLFSNQLDEIAQQFEQQQWDDITRVYLDDFVTNASGDISLAVINARNNIMGSLNSGVSITSYSGHSAPSTWSFDGLLTQADIPTLLNTGHPTIALPLACYTTYADSPKTSTMAHQFMAAGENGAVAIYGAATLSSFADNNASASKVIKYLLENKTIGEAIQKSKIDLGSSYNNIIRNSNLLGDVTLRIK